MAARQPRSDRPSGIALAAVLFVLVLLGLLASAAFFIALKEMQSGQTALLVQRALAGAEGSADSVVDHWNWGAFGGLLVGDSLVFRPRSDGPDRVQVIVTRTGKRFFVVKSAALLGPVRQQVAVVVMLDRVRCGEDSITCSLSTGYDGFGKAARIRERGWVGVF